MSYDFPHYFTVFVSDEDIEVGEQNSETQNPLALAFARNFNLFEGHYVPKQLDSVSVFEGCLGFAQSGIINDPDGDDNTIYNFTFHLDPKVYLHTMAFDNDEYSVKSMLVHCCVHEIERDEICNELTVNGEIHLDSHYPIGDIVDGTLIYDILTDENQNESFVR